MVRCIDNTTQDRGDVDLTIGRDYLAWSTPTSDDDPCPGFYLKDDSDRMTWYMAARFIPTPTLDHDERDPPGNRAGCALICIASALAVLVLALWLLSPLFGPAPILIRDFN